MQEAITWTAEFPSTEAAGALIEVLRDGAQPEHSPFVVRTAEAEVRTLQPVFARAVQTHFECRGKPY